MKTICSLMVGLGNVTLATTFSGSTVDNLVFATLAASVGLAGLFSWRWLLSSASTQQLADVQIFE